MEQSISENEVHAVRMGNGAGEARDLSGSPQDTMPATPQSSGTSQSNTPRLGPRGGTTPRVVSRQGSSKNFLRMWGQQRQQKGQEGERDAEEDVGRAMKQSIEVAADVVSHFFRTGRIPERVQSLPNAIRAGPSQPRPSGSGKMKPTGSTSIDGAAGRFKRMSKSMVELQQALDSAQRLQVSKVPRPAQ